MQRLHFCSGMVFTTGDTVALALLRYAEAVAKTDSSDVMIVPVAGRSPGSHTVTLLLNAASQISAESIDFEGGELLDAPFVSRLEALTADLLEPVVWDGTDPFARGVAAEA